VFEVCAFSNRQNGGFVLFKNSGKVRGRKRRIAADLSVRVQHQQILTRRNLLQLVTALFVSTIKNPIASRRFIFGREIQADVGQHAAVGSEECARNAIIRTQNEGYLGTALFLQDQSQVFSIRKINSAVVNGKTYFQSHGNLRLDGVFAGRQTSNLEDSVFVCVDLVIFAFTGNFYFCANDIFDSRKSFLGIFFVV